MAETIKVDRLIFAYRADTGRVSALLESARKLLTIDGCALCSITHGLAGEKEEWRSCREEIAIPVESVYRNQLAPPLAKTVGDRLPAVVAEAGGTLELLLGPEELERCRGSVGELKALLGRRAASRRLEIPGLGGPGLELEPSSPPLRRDL